MHTATALLITIAALLVPWTARAQCEPSGIVRTPLNELGCGEYDGNVGGLYGDGRNLMPEAHELAGLAIAEGLSPIDGRIAMISVGMSNTTQEFRGFAERAAMDPTVRSELTVVDTAWGSHPITCWTDPYAEPTDPRCNVHGTLGTANGWNFVDSRLEAAGVRPDQVQVAWIKHAFAGVTLLGEFPVHAELLTDALIDTIRAAKVRYPNLRLVYLSSRTHAYVEDVGNNPEPYAYEAGFSTRWVIDRQIAGDPLLSYSGPDAEAPWIAWGPYIWAEGTRDDGFSWPTTAVRDDDCTHPSPQGRQIVADALWDFFTSDRTATRFFLDDPPPLPARPIESGCTGSPEPDAGTPTGDAGTMPPPVTEDGGAAGGDAGAPPTAPPPSSGCDATSGGAGTEPIGLLGLTLFFLVIRKRRRGRSSGSWTGHRRSSILDRTEG